MQKFKQGLELGGLQLRNSNGNLGIFTCSNTTDRTYTFPDKSGTVALLNDIPSGFGTVTSISIVSANGISGTVANPTTTPTITFTLGAITPTSISLNTNGDSTPILFSTYKGANSTGGNIWIGGGGQSSYGDSGNLNLGSFNTSLGLDALSLNTQGYNNSAFAINALQKNTTGHDNVANGGNAGFSNTTGSYNTYNGVRAGQTNQTGNYNTGDGYYSLYFNTASNNSGFGAYACYKNTTGDNNFGGGYYALYNNTVGVKNTALGAYAFTDLNITVANTGSNTGVGFNTGRGITTGINNTILGANVTGLDAALSNNIILADGSGSIKAQYNGTGWTLAGSVTSPSFIKSGGTSSQFLKADGSVDSTSYLNATGFSSPWGITPTSGPLVTMGTASSATWLVGGKSGSTFRGGLQLLDSGAALRLYANTNYLELGPSGVAYNGNLLAIGNHNHDATYVKIGGALGTPASGVLTNCTGTAAGLTAGSSLKLGNYGFRTAGQNWGIVPLVAEDGCMEIGRYIDFHETSADTSDYSVRLNGTSGALACSGTFSATSFSGAGTGLTGYAPNLMAGYTINTTVLDLSTLDVSTWYPVTFVIPANRRTRCRIKVALDSGTVPSWSTHAAGFDVLCDWTSNGCGWGTTQVLRTIHAFNYGHATVAPVGGVGQMTNSSLEYVYLRGGGKYKFETDYPVTPTIQTASYTTNSQTVAPSTTLVNNVWSTATCEVGFKNVLVTGQFIGAGTGLTGTAASLSIGGNAATATTANRLGGAGTYTNEDALTFAQRNAKGVSFGRTKGATDAPGGDTGYYNYILLPEVIGSNSQAILAMGVSNSRIFYGYGLYDAAPTWRELIHSGNIGTQSVNYATTAGSAPASDVYAWAKASTKPSYTFSEIGSGTISATTGTFSGNATAASFIKSGGTSSQFLKANGSVDSNSYLNATGFSTSWGTPPTSGPLVTMGTSSGATWLVGGTSNGTFRGGLQLLDQGAGLRLYAGTNYLELGSTGVAHNGNTLAFANHNHDTTYAKLGGADFTGPVTTTSTLYQGVTVNNPTGTTILSRSYLYGTIDINSTAPLYSHYTESKYKIASGVTNNSTMAGYVSVAFRNNGTTGDSGTQTALMGALTQFGHYNSDDTATPITVEALGYKASLYCSTGTISNAYGSYIALNHSGGTVTNKYGIYITGVTGATNNNYSIYATSGAAYFADSLTASQFNGSGAGLTGSAPNLSVYSSNNLTAQLGDNLTPYDFDQYSGLRFGKGTNNGRSCTFLTAGSNAGSTWQLLGPDINNSSDTALTFQVPSDSENWNSYDLIHTGNIGSQSVNYANTTNNVNHTISPSSTASHYLSLSSSIAGACFMYHSATLYYIPNTGVMYATDFSASSDKRLKTDIKPILGALDKVKAINGVTFKWNELSQVEDKETEQVGVIAQDVLKVLPQAVNQSGEYLSVSYGKLVPLLIEAIKEQQKQIDELKRLIK